MTKPSQVDLSSMTLFVAIVEEGSLSAASRALGTPKATVSRRLAELERQAGAPLLARSTRALTLTDLGRRHYDRVRDLVHEARAAQAELLAGSFEPSGLLRVSASYSYGQLVIAPRVVAFAARYPRLRVELELSDERVNVISDRYDMVIRMGSVEDSELVSRRLAEISIFLVASPDYIKRAGAPARPADLTSLEAIIVPVGSEHWHVGGDNVRVKGRVATHSIAVARLAALAGLGIAPIPTFLIADDLAGGALVRVLPQFELPRSPATALYPRAVTPSPALRLLLDDLRSLPSPGEPYVQQGEAGSRSCATVPAGRQR